MPHPRANLCYPIAHGGDLQPVKCLPKNIWGIGGIGIDRYKLKTPLKSITMAVFLSLNVLISFKIARFRS